MERRLPAVTIRRPTPHQKAIRLAEMQNLLFLRDRDEVKDPRWAEHTAAGRQAAADLASAALFGLRNVAKADFAAVSAEAPGARRRVQRVSQDVRARCADD